MTDRSLLRTVQISAFAALMVLGTFIRIPLGPVPVVLTNLFVVLSGYLLGPSAGCSAVVLYLFLGLIGLPVFSAGGGAALFLGPTGGYLIGYIIACLCTGIIAKIHPRGSAVVDILAVSSGLLVLYIPGLLWLKHMTGLSWDAAIKGGFLPFIPGDALKAVAAFVIIRGLRRSVPDLFPVFTKEKES